MNRFERAIEILDSAVGGASTPVSFHGAFWRGVNRDEFVAKKIFGFDLIKVGDGANSNLVQSLKGEGAFGADTGNPAASFNRMPSGLSAVADSDIEFIAKWIDEGCLEDDFVDDKPLSWRRTGAPFARRHDDVWFLDRIVGWAVNSDGNIIKTNDGGEHWTVQQSLPGVYLRCIGFAGANRGWVGTLTRNRRLLSTQDGGASWTAISALPDKTPVAICGLSVVSDQVVFASGTNRPADAPGMIKSLDGGTTWHAWDMSQHASILIDTYFTDSQHGWVVGGKASEPTPTTRDKLKPVILETDDGGTTWINRLAGQEDDFPFGEWGWKIQFLNDQIGFVSLENFTDAAILKTIDGGKTWERLKVNDPQGNANLEGIGFLDEKRGWVGGWGSADFTKGYSSATTDGGATWEDANEIGLFLNRFRFIGDPVAVGYSSGDTIYKFSSDPVHAAVTAQSDDPARAMLPDAHIQGTTSETSFRVDVPEGTKRLTIDIWDWYGTEIGCVSDEINPKSGTRVIAWDGCDAQGTRVDAGRYIARLTADDHPVSSFLVLGAGNDVIDATKRRAVPSRMSFTMAQPPKLNTLTALMAEPERSLDWLKNALQIAIQLELSTLPPYLTARWSIKDIFTDPVAESIKEIRGEEMLHFGLACNLLVAIGGTPLLANPSVVPTYPGPLPGGVRPGLQVSLKKLSRQQARVFMDIEYPQGGPIATAAIAEETFDSIGEFYEAVLAAFKEINPELSLDRQLQGSPGVFKIDAIAKVEEAINLINLQGEGSNSSPEEASGDLAHYYRFGEIHHGKRFVQDADGNWGYNGDDVPMPEVHDMADVPAGGYQQPDVPDAEAWELIASFDKHYSDMLRLLQDAWTHGDQAYLGQAISKMFAMNSTGIELVKRPRPDGQGNYGPCFRFVN